MLYVFQMDAGQMLTFDISFLMDSVSRLQHEIARVTGIGMDQQILLMSGGQSLHADQKVMAYGAGADTNPVFLFSKVAITSQDPPLVKSFGIPRDVLGALRTKAMEALQMPAGFETVMARTKVAVQIRDSASSILKFCDNEFKEQHLQHQGWSAVVANLEEIAHALEKTKVKFTKVFSSFLPLRDKYFGLLSDFQETLELLSRIPILKSLKESDVDLGGDDEIEVVKKSLEQESRSLIASGPVPSNLLEWITTQGQGQSIEGLQLKCYNELVMFNEDMFDAYEAQVQGMLDQVKSDPNQMKELLGIERRLYELERRLNEAKKISETQYELAQAFLYQQSRLKSTPDSSVLPDLCTSHHRQLQQMWDGQQRIEALQNNFRKSKQEMSTNIHQRLGWVVHIETQISQLDSDLIFHMKTLKILEMNLDLLGQVKTAPKVYADMIMEAARRKFFSEKFSQWATGLVEDSKLLYDKEVQCRNQFASRHGKHFFLHTLFKGFEDMPPNFATKAPSAFDETLPAITQDEIACLKISVPELEESLTLPDELSVFPGLSMTKKLTGSPLTHVVLPSSQSSQTEWTQVHTPVKEPFVITATEAPATTFTLPELHESNATEYLPAVSSLTDMRGTMSAQSNARLVVTGPTSAVTDDKDSKSSGSDAAPDSGADPPTGQARAKTNSISTEKSASPLSSNEFATADFYIEENMPSPMRSKSDSETISSLQAEVLEKLKRIQALECLLKEKGVVSSSEDVSHGSGSLTVIGGAESSEQVIVSHSSDADNMEIVAFEHLTDKEDKLASPGAEVERLKSEIKEIERKLSERDAKIEELYKNVSTFEADIASMTNDLKTKNTLLDSSKEELMQTTKTCDALREDVKNGEVSLCRVKDRLKEFRDGMKTHVPVFRTKLEELKTTVVNNKTDLDSAITDVMKSVESKINTFNLAVLASANKEFQAEKESLMADIHRLQAEVHAAQREKKESVLELSQQNNEMTSKLSEKNKELSNTLEAQQKDFETKLKEMETKYSLELEIELDKSKSEMRKQLEELEKNCESLSQMKEDLSRELVQVKVAADQSLESHSQVQAGLKEELKRERGERESERARLVKEHEEAVLQLEKRRAEEGEAATHRLAQVEAGVEERLREGQLHIDQLQNQLTALERSLAEEKSAALDKLREEMAAEKDTAISEQTGRLTEDHAANLERQKKELMEEHTQAINKQLDELTQANSIAVKNLRVELSESQTAALEKQKAELLEEKNAALEQQRQELSAKNASEQEALETNLLQEHKASLSQLLEEKQLDYAQKLTELKVQFDLERETLQKELSKYRDLSLTTSQTQTGLELLSEVISLTSSASYGSEEMIAANRQSASVGEDKDATADTNTKMQQTIDDLTTQLAEAQETICSLNSELIESKSNLQVASAESSEKDSSDHDVSPLRLAMLGAEGGLNSDLTQSTMTDTTSSFILMDKEPSSPEKTPALKEMKLKDEQIAQLQKKVMEMSVTSVEKEKESSSDKVSIKGCDRGDLVLLCLDERHNQYVVFTVGTNLHFLHSESLDALGLKTDAEASRKTWILAEVVDKEYCLAKKPNNRFRVPQGTCFYRVRCKAWKCDSESVRGDRDQAKQGKMPPSDSKGARPKKSEKK